MKHERKSKELPAVDGHAEAAHVSHTVKMRRDNVEMNVAKADVESHLRMGWRIVVGED